MRAKGVAQFERWAAEHELEVPYDAVTRLYQARRPAAAGVGDAAYARAHTRSISRSAAAA